MDFKRTAGWAGIVAVAFFVLNLALAGSTPAPDDSVNKIGEYLASDIGLHKWSLAFGVLAAIPLLAFLAGFLVPIFRSDREHGEGFGVIIFGGLLLLGASATVANAALAALTYRGGDGLGAETVRALYDIQVAAYGAGGIAMTIFGAGVAMVVFRRHVMDRWVGWLATVVAVTGFLGLITLTNEGNAAMVGFVPFIGLLIWILSVSITMVRSSSNATAG